MSEQRRPERGVTTAAQLLAKLQSQAPTSVDSVTTAFLDTLEQLSFYERPDLPPLLAALPAALPAALALLLTAAPNTRHGRGLFTRRSLACYAIGRLSSLHASAKAQLQAATGPARLAAAVLGVLDERSPFSHVTALNVLVDWGGERAAMDGLVAAGGVKRVVALYWHHDGVQLTSEDDAEGREAQMAIKVFAMSLLANVAQLNPLEPSVAEDGAIDVALHIIHTEDNEPLLLPALKLLYCLASTTPPPAAITAALTTALHTGHLMALTTAASPYLSNASKALLALTELGQRARRGEPIGRQQLGELEYGRFEGRVERLRREAAGQAGSGSGGGGDGEGGDGGAVVGGVGVGGVKCGGCGKVQGAGAGFAACGRCRGVRYCSKECQMQHWKAHKAQCNKR